MKVCVCYDVCFEVDVPEDAIKAIREQGLNHLDEGDVFNTYFREQYENIRKVLNSCDGTDIQGIYNQDYIFDNDNVIFTNDVDEVIWEG